MTTKTVTPIVRNLRGLQLINAARDLLVQPVSMEEKTGLEGARYNQADGGTNYDGCGAAACVVGWMAYLAGLWDGATSCDYDYYAVAYAAGLERNQIYDLYFGEWEQWGEPCPENGDLCSRTNAAAVRVLDRLIAEQEAKQLQS